MDNTRLTTALMSLAVLVGCVPSDPVGLGPTAVRASNGAIEILYTACSSENVKAVALIRPSNPDLFSETDPPVWKVSFSSPSPSRQFVVGQTPVGAAEEVRLTQPLEVNVHYEAVIILENGLNPRQGFQLDKLGEKVAFHGRYMSKSDFERETTCSSS